MNLFDKLVSQALHHQPLLSPLRIVVEKELLHHDILRILSQNNLLKNLTFIGGTCLRSCYGNPRLSEDLDFTGGLDFNRETLSLMGDILKEILYNKYGLPVQVSPPVKESSQESVSVDTWKIKIETRPHHKNIPSQRIHIDICALPSYERQPILLLNPYGVDMGTYGLIIQAQSREEIYIDKLIAFALRPNRIKYRDLWDIFWLHGQGVKPQWPLLPLKIQDRHQTNSSFFHLFRERQESLQNPLLSKEFMGEMKRFLPPSQETQILQQPSFWDSMVLLIRQLKEKIQHTIG